jgi:hypothetical protein
MIHLFSYKAYNNNYYHLLNILKLHLEGVILFQKLWGWVGVTLNPRGLEL